MSHVTEEPETPISFALTDPDYLREVHRAFSMQQIGHDEVYLAERNEAQVATSPTLQYAREKELAARMVPPSSSGAPGGTPLIAPGVKVPVDAAGHVVPTVAPTSTAHAASEFLSSIGIRGPRPTSLVSDLVDMVIPRPSRPDDALYVTAKRLAKIADGVLTTIQVPITGAGDLANLVFAPITMGLRAAGVSEPDVERFIEGTRMVPELAVLPELVPPALRGTGTRLSGAPAQVADAVVSRAPVLRGGAGVPLPPVRPDTLAEMAAFYRDAVLESRRGTRSHAVASAEADALVQSGSLSPESLKRIMPGTAMDDAHAVATVKLLTESGLKLRALADDVLLAVAPEERAQASTNLLQQLWLHAQIDPARLGVLAESGRTLSALNEPVSGMNQYLAQFTRLFGDITSGVTPEGVAQMIRSFETPEQLAIAARQLNKPGWGELFREVWVNGLLSGPKTWAANLLGNGAATFWAIPERGLAEVFGSGVADGETLALLKGAMSAVYDAWALGWNAYKATGAEALASGTKSEIRPAMSSQALQLSGTLGQAVDYLGTAVRVPSTILSVTDEFFKVLNYRMELRALSVRQAFREGASRGLQGDELVQFLQRREPEILADPPLTLVQQSKQFAAYQTFTNELGAFGQGVQKAASTPAGKLILPFVRTPINIFKYAAERTPMGLFMREVQADLRGADVARRDLALSKLALGSMTLALVGTLASLGYVTGGGPKDPELARTLRGLGWQPYSIRIGDTYVSYNRTEPVGMLLGLGADLANALESAEGDSLREQVEHAVVASAVATARNLTSRTFVKGLAETLTALSDPEQYADRSAGAFVGSLIPFSGLVRQVEQVMDPTLAEAHGVLERALAGVPGHGLPPYRDLFGTPYVPGGIYGPVAVSRLKDDPVLKELVANEVRISPLPHTIERIELEPEERDRFAVLRGREVKIGGLSLRERLEKVIASGAYQRGSTGPEGRRALLLKEWVLTYTERAQEDLLRDPKFSALRESVDKAKTDRVKALTAPPQTAPLTNLIRSLGR